MPGLMWWPDHIPAGAQYDEMMSHIDCWATLAAMVGLTPPPHEWVGNDGKPIYFDSIDNSAYILGKAQHSARESWIYIDGETFKGARADIGGDPKQPWAQYRVEVSLHGQGLLARLGAEPGCDRRDLQPHDGSVREVRHDLQRRRAGASADDVAGQVCGTGQRLGAWR